MHIKIQRECQQGGKLSAENSIPMRQPNTNVKYYN